MKHPDASLPAPMPNSMLWVFCLPNVVIGLLISALAVVIPAFYAKYTATSLAAVGAVLFSVRIIEAVVDPVAGYLSDITRTRFGPRKPWLMAGSLLAPVGIYFVFNPSTDSGQLYFFCAYLFLVMTSWTAMVIPYRAWAVELTRDYDARSKIFTMLGVAYGIGAVIFAAFPFLPGLANTEMSPANISWLGWGLIIAFPMLIGLTVSVVPVGLFQSHERSTLKGLTQSILSNRPLIWFLAAFIVGGVGQGIVLACFFFYIDIYLGLGDKFSLSLLAVYLTGIASMPLWFKLMEKIGKHRVWAVGWGGAALLGLSMLFVPRGMDGLYVLLIVVGLYGACSSVESFAPYALLGDVIDYDKLRTGVNRSGNYNALAVFGSKVNLAIGGAIGYFLLEFFGYNVSGGANSRQTELGFLFTFIGLPFLLYSLSFFMIWRFPLNRRKHDTVRRRLDQLESRSQA
jgi:Na+/melibiose symporter-like transporter